ncbi:MerR family transcriptional regulator [Mycolicibacter arupensis]|jgi:hypothetical protein|uniref:DNA-binding protein n=1 Tax=Mycolicibacter arupensis TaxID=342002 RepID=A0A0F5MSH5_9MYCO|nr:DNA-binding protein [Mycolicibacter arupensis]KKB97007.1 hypothetical protein WR43_20950 [Mycolicibacter arupensis]MCV7275237.1 DNA-binding protein [Mycolicibacter arupensis]OQZ90237.1 hypothetical protein BST15_20765 [Mycolicibacter arupensis]TXI59984.1 MAG: DNA-binding protein [Mycolicibacter arupensis]
MDEQPERHKTYSLAEVAELVLPPEMKDPERWLRRHLNAGDIRGYKTGRIWRMTQAHLDWLLDHLSNSVKEPAPAAEPNQPGGPVSIFEGMSKRAQARILRHQASGGN